MVSSAGASALARGLLARWSNPSIFQAFQARLESELPGSPLRQSLVQAHLKVDELYGSLLDVVNNGRGSVAMMLSRSQLETAAFLCWVAVADEPPEWKSRLIRLVGQEIRDANERYPSLEPEPAYADIEKRSRALRRLDFPRARSGPAAVSRGCSRRTWERRSSRSRLRWRGWTSSRNGCEKKGLKKAPPKLHDVRPAIGKIAGRLPGSTNAEILCAIGTHWRRWASPTWCAATSSAKTRRKAPSSTCEAF